MRHLSLQLTVISLFLLSQFVLCSCTTPKNTSYFQTVPYNSEIQTLITKDYEQRVRPDDILQITIVSASEEAKSYNTSPEGYLVDKNGNIQIYKLGDIKVEGLTLAQVKERLTKILVPDYFKQVAVTAQFKNHRVILLGEVGSPGVIPMPTENLSIIEAIAASGDLRATARRDNVLIIRNTERGKQFFRLNLLDGSIFNSPFYYLRPDDIVYVEQEVPKKSGNLQQTIAFISSGITLIFLVIDRITR